MHTSEKKISKSLVVQLILDNIKLFESFENVYLFGSLVKQGKKPEDVDLLLVYKHYLADLLLDIDKLCTVFDEKYQISLDLTILSAKEVKETNFVKRLSSSYLKLK